MFLMSGCGAVDNGAYTNTAYHYAIRYPGGWKLMTPYDNLIYPGMQPGKKPDPATASFIMLRKGSAVMTLTVCSNPGHRSPRSWYNNNFKDKCLSFPYPASTVEGTEDVQINSLQAYKVTLKEASHAYTCFITHADNIYILSFEKYPAAGEDPALPQSDFDFMLANFSFTD